MQNRGRGLRNVYVLAGTQSAVTILAAVLVLGFMTPQAAVSSLLGGAICLLGTLVFGLRLFAGGTILPAAQVLRRFYAGAAQKFVLTLVLFMLALKWPDVNFLILVLTYIAAASTYWFALLFRL